jgi:hypothetical protein
MARATTGFLHIARLHGDPVTATYRLVFAALGGRLRSTHAECQGLDELTSFLRRAGVPIPKIELAWRGLAKRRTYSVARVMLTDTQLDALGL